MTRSADSFARTFVLAATVAAAWATPGCADPVPTAAQPCPCASGYVCCASGVCAANQDACGAATAALSVAAAGEWTGYFENFVFPSGSDDLRITLSSDAAGELTAKVTMGQGVPPAPATDGDTTWPPGAEYWNGALNTTPERFEGFAYSARDLKWQARRLKFWVRFNEPWRPWCQLQTSYLIADDSYLCVPNSVVDKQPDGTCQTAEGVTVDCNKDALCKGNATCTCTASGCVENEFGLRADFDIALRGDTGDGSMDTVNIRLMRVAR